MAANRRAPGSQEQQPSRKGDTLRQQGQARWELGTIIDYSAKSRSYMVKTSSGRNLAGVGRVLKTMADASVLPRDTTVVIHYELGMPAIDGVWKEMPMGAAELKDGSVSGVPGIGGYDGMNNNDRMPGAHRSPGEPNDLVGGDEVVHGKQGNLMGVLAGGDTVMESSPMASVRTNATESLVSIFSRKFKQFSDFGVMEIKNEGGKTSLLLRGGSDQTSETGGDVEKWSVKLELGAEGDMVNLEVLRPTGDVLARFHMDGNGRVEVMGTAGVDLVSGDRGESKFEMAGGLSETIGASYKKSVQDRANYQFRSGRTTSVSKNDSTIVGGTTSVTAQGDSAQTVGGVHRSTIGTTVKPLPGALAARYDYVQGGLEHVIGDLKKGAIPTAMQGYNLINYAGPMNFVGMPTSPLTMFNVLTTLPKSVNLGCDGFALPNPATGGHTVVPIPAPFSVMKFEPWLAMMTVLMTWLGTHIHPSAVGPTGPPLTAPALAPIAAQFAAIPSIRVGVGM